MSDITRSSSDSLKKLQQDIDERKIDLSKQSRTSKLWISYIKMVDIARMLVMGDRMGDWERHLGAVSECLLL